MITERLTTGALEAVQRSGGTTEDVTIVKVPGAFEIPLAAKKLATTKKYDAVVCLGAVIRGSTPHFDFVANEMSKGIANVSLETGVPVAFGVITADNLEQAIERAGTKQGNKGEEAVFSAVEMVHTLRKISD
jgi:6,7-dimethyl-8-ribityllumazine synthase